MRGDAKFVGEMHESITLRFSSDVGYEKEPQLTFKEFTLENQ